MIDIIKPYLLAAIALALLAAGYMVYSTIEDLKSEVASLKYEYSQLQGKKLASDLEAERYKSILDEFAHDIKIQNIAYEAAQKELAKWKADAARFAKIEKHLPAPEIIKRGNCEDVETYFNSLDGLDLDSL
ncbi:MAG: hypothetical protein IBX43_04990 [Campylobacterales bacterium]|nr:hypothetical protein [Campylobacterales bacterium]